MMIWKTCIYHMFCCMLGMIVIGMNLTFTQNGIIEIILYIVYSITVIVFYFIIGYRFVEIGGAIKIQAQIWFISFVIIIVGFISVEHSLLFNLSFQPLFALFDDMLSQEKIYVISSLCPSFLIELGYIYKLINMK